MLPSWVQKQIHIHNQKAVDNGKESRTELPPRKGCQEANLSKDSIDTSSEAGAKSVAKLGDATVVKPFGDTILDSQS